MLPERALHKGRRLKLRRIRSDTFIASCHEGLWTVGPEQFGWKISMLFKLLCPVFSIMPTFYVVLCFAH